VHRCWHPIGAPWRSLVVSKSSAAGIGRSPEREHASCKTRQPGATALKLRVQSWIVATLSPPWMAPSVPDDSRI